MPSGDAFLRELRGQYPDLEIGSGPDRIAPYCRDEAHQTTDRPIAVAFPTMTSQVVTLLKLANRHHVPIVPQGARTGLSGAAVPSEGSFVVSLERMNRILEIDEENGVAVTEPGVITGDLRRAVEQRGLFYPPIPASVDICTIGGNIATNAGGLCAVKYGVTREYVLGLEVVLPSGDVIQTGGRFAKNSTGYNLTQLLVGSEGTLGIVTKIILRLVPLPRERVTLLVPYDSAAAVSKSIVAILSARIVPPTLELIPQGAVRCVLNRHSELSYPFPDHPASLLIELDSRDSASLQTELPELERVLRESGAGEPSVAATPAQREELWTVRKLVRDSIANSGDYVEADAVVPRRKVPALLEAADTVSKKHAIEVISYGHAGDGNLHTYFRRGDLPTERWRVVSQKVLTDFFTEAVRLGGTISGEHGIGLLKREYLPMAISPPQINVMKRIKTAFDPHGILNPGKILPE
ncbi:MAG TPA: FAD-linked oxidase C-terminal domain-containing protein [Bdellovibrionota bacterium]|nr:FAD-linked oxidase C-terminal domain-containing protein [Bdellovibrionota bacterium]